MLSKALLAAAVGRDEDDVVVLAWIVVARRVRFGTVQLQGLSPPLSSSSSISQQCLANHTLQQQPSSMHTRLSCFFFIALMKVLYRLLSSSAAMLSMICMHLPHSVS